MGACSVYCQQSIKTAKSFVTKTFTENLTFCAGENFCLWHPKNRWAHTCIHVIVIFQCHAVRDEGALGGGTTKKVTKSFHALAKKEGSTQGKQ